MMFEYQLQNSSSNCARMAELRPWGSFLAGGPDDGGAARSA